MNGQSCCTPSRGSGSDPVVVTEPLSTTQRFTENMVSIPGGRFLMGTVDPEGWEADAEAPIREVEVSPFSMDAYAVTNREFQEFVTAAGYQSEAEKFGWSYVFILQLPKGRRKKGNFVGRSSQCEWWIGVKGAYWKAPTGPGSDVRDLLDHPVVHISWADAVAFANWAGKRLPTEAEWEFAARGGLVQNRYPWGNELLPNQKHMCNIWQGKFPEINRGDDGYKWTAPVKTFAPNGFGLYQMSGNVWEWCSDWWGTTWDTTNVPQNPTGPERGEARVIRGGSFLCHRSYCNRYRVAARSKNTPDSTTSHCGFRCVIS